MVTVLVDLAAAPPAQGVAVVLAQDPAPPPGKGEEFGKASPIALVVVLLLAIALVFLIRSMTKHLRRVPASFDVPAEQARADDAARTDTGSRAAERGRAVPGSPDGPADR
jgi:hypothetical protein